MANFNAFHNFRIDLLNPETMASGNLVGMPSVTPTSLIAQTGSGVISFTGTNFSVDFMAETATGTVTGATYAEGGRVVASVTGLNVDVERMIELVTSENNWSSIDTEEFLVSGNDVITTSGANDILYGGAGNDVIDGGAGFDIGLYRVGRAGFEIERDASGAVTVSKGGEVDTYHNVERIQFQDSTLALDVDGTAGQAYRIYQAAFDRTPDTEGLKYWIQSMDKGMDLQEVSQRFTDSSEFKALYSTSSAADYVGSLYRNILDREGEAEGVDFWVEQITSGSRDMAKVLADFSESSENVMGVAPIISDGIWIS